MEDPIGLFVANDSEPEASLTSPDGFELELEKQATTLLVVEATGTATSTASHEEPPASSSSECSNEDDSDEDDFEQWKPRGPSDPKVAGKQPTKLPFRDARVQGNTKANTQKPQDKAKKVSKAPASTGKVKVRS